MAIYRKPESKFERMDRIDADKKRVRKTRRFQNAQEATWKRNAKNDRQIMVSGRMDALLQGSKIKGMLPKNVKPEDFYMANKDAYQGKTGTAPREFNMNSRKGKSMLRRASDYSKKRRFM